MKIASESKVKILAGIVVAEAICLALVFFFSLIKTNDSPAPDRGGEGWRSYQQDNVRETVFRQQIAEIRKSDQICFLTIRNVHYDNSVFMLRFKESSFVKPLSEADLTGNNSPLASESATFTDRQTGKPALHFWIDSLEWISDEEAEVKGGSAAGGLSGGGGVFVVQWRNERWFVTDFRQGHNL